MEFDHDLEGIMVKKGKGTIGSFDPETKQGVIRPDDGSGDIRFAASSVIDGRPQVGLTVEFEARPDGNSFRAYRTIIVGGTPLQPPKPARQGSAGYNQAEIPRDRNGLQRKSPPQKEPVARSPRQWVFETLYTENPTTGERNLRQEIFFEAAIDTARTFRDSNLKSTQLRMLFQGYRSFCTRLIEGKISFEKARELFSEFYVTRVVRQRQRGLLPDPVVDLFEAHKGPILSSAAEMKGFFKYLTNILCYFGDKDK